MKSHSLQKRDWLFLCAAIGLHLVFALTAFGWGMDGYVPWAADGIEGVTTVREMPKLFGKWDYKYPRLQFLIDGTCYKPFMEQWQRTPEYVTVDGQMQAQVLTPERLKTLAGISRVNVIVMSALTVMFVYLAGRYYYKNALAGFVAAVCTVLTYAFAYYSHTTCVDVPSMLWLTAGFYFLLRSEAMNRLRDHAAMGAMFAFACTTKDAMLFYAVAFAVVYAGLRLRRLYGENSSWKKSLRQLAAPQALTAAGVFLILFALLQNIIPWPGAYWERMGVWVGGRGVKDFNQGFTGQIPLLIDTLQQFLWGMGWPLAAAVLIALVVTSRKHLLFNLLAIVFPLVFFYVFVAMQIRMSFIRYYVPVMGLLYLPVGCLAAQLFENRRQWAARAGLGALAAGWALSGIYCAALMAELIGDSRSQTAQWFVQNVPKGSPVLSCIMRPYGPKLRQFGYPMLENWNVPPLQTLLAAQNTLPEYVILSNSWLNLKSPEAREFRTALLKNQTNYQLVASFTHRKLLIPQKSWMAAVCWPVRPRYGISPEVYVLKQSKPAVSRPVLQQNSRR